MKKCPMCGMEVEDSMKFCNACGAPLDSVQPAQDSAFENDEQATVLVDNAQQVQPNMYQQPQQQMRPNMYQQPQQQMQPNMYQQPQQQMQPNMYQQPQQQMRPNMYQQPQQQMRPNMYQQPQQQMRPNMYQQPQMQPGAQPVQIAFRNIVALIASIVSLFALFVGNIIVNPNHTSEGFNLSDTCEQFRKMISRGYDDDDKIFVMLAGYLFYAMIALFIVELISAFVKLPVVRILAVIAVIVTFGSLCKLVFDEYDEVHFGFNAFLCLAAIILSVLAPIFDKKTNA